MKVASDKTLDTKSRSIIASEQSEKDQLSTLPPDLLGEAKMLDVKPIPHPPTPSGETPPPLTLGVFSSESSDVPLHKICVEKSISTLIFKLDRGTQPPLIFEPEAIFFTDPDGNPTGMPNFLHLVYSGSKTLIIVDINQGGIEQTIHFGLNVIQSRQTVSLKDPSIVNHPGRVQPTPSGYS